MKTWEFTQDNDEQEIQFDRTYGETSTQYHSIEFTFLDEDTTDEQQKACLGPVAACASGWGVIEPTTLTLEVTCKDAELSERISVAVHRVQEAIKPIDCGCC